MEKLRSTDYKLLFELIKNSHRSDRELARVLKVSQPTVTRIRNKLVKQGLIKEFTIIPNLSKLGFEIMAIICVKARSSKELTEKAIKVTMANPNIIFAARADGMGKNAMLISLHKNYSEYSSFIADLMMEHGKDVEDYDTLLISMRGLIVKPFSLKYIGDLDEK
jgi:DNA-binding Lrp family transcriptional regulator